MNEENKKPWISVLDSSPEKNITVEVLCSDGEIAWGMLDENYWRTTWLIQGSDGLYWRSFIRSVVSWRTLEPIATTAK